MTIRNFIKFIEGWLGKLNFEEGLLHGNTASRIKGITVCWMATEKTIASAVKRRHNLVIVHEDLLFPPGYASSDSANLTEKPGIVSAKRIALLQENSISVLRLHSLTDRHFVLDTLSDILSLGEPLVKKGLQRVYEIKPVAMEKFAADIRKKLGVSHVRVMGNPSKKVKRIGGLWGGVGLSINAGFINNILAYKIDTAVAGEVDEYTMRAFSDMGIGMVEIGHEKSEEPGLMHFADTLKEKLKNMPVHYSGDKESWRLL
ncbi:MAG: Nif3-like dinuclear metal center hexameric protein [Candidatus Omnitrophica bacterium]|nr:Nif3-like dinuclear metal center hexameric protein [Candidatus Omnitrophota bacterium]